MIGSYERISTSLLRNQPKPAPFGKFIDGRLHVGTQSLHRTDASRRWRMFWRLKRLRTRTAP